MSQTRSPLAAIDARLICGDATGDSTYWTGLLHGLAEVASEDRLLLVSNAPRPEKIPWSSNWEWLNLPSRSSRLWSLVTFPLAARRALAPAVHTQYNLSPLVRRGGVTTIHDVSFFIGPQWFGAKDRLLLQRFVPASARRSARVITVSATSRDEIERYIPAAIGKVAVTPLATPPWIHKVPRQDAKQRVAALTGVDEPYGLTIGTSWPRKNQQLAIEAVMGLPVSIDLKLYVAGRGSEREASGNRVRRLGFVAEAALPALYSGAEVLVFPSLHEGFGLPVVEAFTCGCPVLCGKGGALPETAGGAARLMDDYDPRTWSSALGEMVSSNLDDLRDRGFARAASFSWTETARLTRDIYREVGAESTKS